MTDFFQEIVDDTIDWWADYGIDILIAIGIFLGFVILNKLFTKYIFKLLLRMTAKTKMNLDEHILYAFEKPIRVFFIILGLYIAIDSLPFLGFQSKITIITAFRSAIIILLAWGLTNLAGVTTLWIEWLGKRMDVEVDKILIPFFSKVLKFIIIALAITVVAQEWKYDVNGLVTGLGIGGLAFALAAKDAIGNVFGGVIIIAEKPFTLGDWIRTPSIEGTVEDITFRSTKIRTFAQGLVTIPNSTLANEPITNWSKMGKRRINFNLGVTYTTPRAKMEKVVNEIRDMLKNHPAIHQETLFVHFDKFNDSSLDIFLYFFTKTTNWGEWLMLKEEFNLKIMEILENEGVEIAFPSRSIYFENKLEQTDTNNS